MTALQDKSSSFFDCALPLFDHVQNKNTFHFLSQKELAAEAFKNKIFPVLDKIENKVKERNTDYLVGKVCSQKCYFKSNNFV